MDGTQDHALWKSVCVETGLALLNEKTRNRVEGVLIFCIKFTDRANGRDVTLLSFFSDISNFFILDIRASHQTFVFSSFVRKDALLHYSCSCRHSVVNASCRPTTCAYSSCKPHASSSPRTNSSTGTSIRNRSHVSLLLASSQNIPTD